MAATEKKNPCINTETMAVGAEGGGMSFGVGTFENGSALLTINCHAKGSHTSVALHLDTIEQLHDVAIMIALAIEKHRAEMGGREPAPSLPRTVDEARDFVLKNVVIENGDESKVPLDALIDARDAKRAAE